MQRPIGVAVLAVAHFLIAGLYVYPLPNFLRVGMVMRQDNLNDAAAHGIDPWREYLQGQPLLMWGLLFGYAFLVFAMVITVILSLTIGIGLWRLAIWGRILGIALWFVILIFSVFGLLFRLTYRGSLIRIAVAAAILVYLFRPRVKHAFRGARA
jgi:hypothetical protein